VISFFFCFLLVSTPLEQKKEEAIYSLALFTVRNIPLLSSLVVLVHWNEAVQLDISIALSRLKKVGGDQRKEETVKSLGILYYSSKIPLFSSLVVLGRQQGIRGGLQ